MHAHENDLALYIQGRLPAEKLMPLECHLGACKACEFKLSRAAEFFGDPENRKQQLAPEERRRDRRVFSEDQAIMQILSPLSFGRVGIRVVDVSKNGLKLLVPEFLQQGTMVQIRMVHSIMLAEVRHCRKAGEGFHAGVQLQDVFSTSP
ncbi:MAG TPA: PilZ domain-containing protein [Bryobacteraceae bacterium]